MGVNTPARKSALTQHTLIEGVVVVAHLHATRRAFWDGIRDGLTVEASGAQVGVPRFSSALGLADMLAPLDEGH